MTKANATQAVTVECAYIECSITFVQRNAQHGFCSAKCRRAARGTAWKIIREAALIRDEDTCQDCSAAESPLEVHHIIALCRGGDNRLTNLTSLCKPCHRARHRSWKGEIAQWSAGSTRNHGGVDTTSSGDALVLSSSIDGR